MGDSKSITARTWPTILLDTINATGQDAREDLPRNWAVSGYTLSSLKSSIDTFMLEHYVSSIGDKFIFFINIGANDVVHEIVEATWKTDYNYIIDAILAEYPTGKIYITKAWRRDYGTECDTLAGYIDDIVAAYAISNPDHVYVGDDERVWMEGGDNGATMTTDGIHTSATGEITAAAAKITAAGL